MRLCFSRCQKRSRTPALALYLEILTTIRIKVAFSDFLYKYRLQYVYQVRRLMYYVCMKMQKLALCVQSKFQFGTQQHSKFNNHCILRSNHDALDTNLDTVNLGIGLTK